jgi:hypothetical protein
VGPLGISIEAQEGSPPAALLSLLNEVRLDEGLDPYRQSRLLTDAAERHVDDIAINGFAHLENVHLGSDGTDEQERIEEAGYAAWTRNERLIVGENVWSGRGVPEDALASFLEDPVQRDNLLSDTYREVGIGYAIDADGRGYYVLDFGARPNVLPIFINDGAANTDNPEIAIRLTNERARPEGRGTAFMGEAIEIRVSNEPAFEELSWQSWAPLVSWVLPDSAGEHTIYVEFRDAAGRTAASADNIFLDKGTPVRPTVTLVTSTPEPTGSPPSESAATQVPPTTDSESTAEGVPSTPEPTPEPSSQTPVVTPFPTWTPLPSPEPTQTEFGQSTEADALLLGRGGYGRLLAVLGILQGAAVFLGVYLMMRRGGSTRRE